MKDLLLAIDLGTQSVRALAVSLTGDIVARAQRALMDYQRPQPGWVEHDGDRFWALTAACCKQALCTDASLSERIAGVVVTTQRASILPLDAQGQCLSPAIIWMDQRRCQQPPRLAAPWRAAFAAAGVSDTIRGLQHDAELNWWAEHQPEVHARAHKFVLLSGLLHHRLTGRFADSVGCQVGYLPFEARVRGWAPRWDWKWQALAVRPEQMVDLVPVGQLLGEVSAQAAEATALPPGTPVVAAAADKACEVLGVGALLPHVGALSFGTTATINITSPRYLEHTRFVPPYPAAVPGQFNVEVHISRGLWLVSWFKEQFGQAECEAAKRLGVSPESLFEDLLRQTPPGAMGLTMTPTWSPGIRHPGPEAKGALIGLGDVHTRAHLYRALLEGLAYGLRAGRERLERCSGVPMTELRASGGGSQSDLTLQLTADVFRLPVARAHTHDTSGLGAAMVGAVALGLHPGMAAAQASMTRVQRWFEPVPANADLYDALYREVYQPLYPRLSPLLQRLRRITGYPG